MSLCEDMRAIPAWVAGPSQFQQCRLLFLQGRPCRFETAILSHFKFFFFGGGGGGSRCKGSVLSGHLLENKGSSIVCARGEVAYSGVSFDLRMLVALGGHDCG